MLPIHKELGKVRGSEILYFEDAEVQKVKGDSTSFATSGPLSLLYFKDYNRYVLLLNDWKYPLFRRLPVLGLDDQDANSRTYYFPASHGFAFILKINQEKGSFPFHNLDTILERHTRLGWKNHDQAFRKAEESPDDHLNRHLKQEAATGKEIITEKVKQSLHHMKTKLETLKKGTKNLNSRKKRINQSDIKTKDFRKESHSKLGKSFFSAGKKSSQEFWQARLGNLNNFTMRKYEDIKREGASFYIWREDLEESILNNKDIATQGLSSFHLALHKDEKVNMFESAWSEASTQPSSVTDSIVGQGPMETHSRRESIPQREKALLVKQPEHEIQLDKMIEGMSHYQG